MAPMAVSSISANYRNPFHSALVAGFSLVELMVALLLGSFVIGGVVSVYLVTANTSALNQQISALQQTEQFSFQLFSKDVQHAGFIGCANMNQTRVISVVLHPNAAHQRWTDWQNIPGIRGYEAGAVPNFAGSAITPVSGSDAVQLKYAGGPSTAVVSHTGTAISLAHNSAALAAKDVVVVCDSKMAAMFKISQFTASSMTIHHESATNHSPNLGFGPNGVWVPQHLSADAGTVMPLESVAWFVGAVNGRQSLYRVRYHAEQVQAEEIVSDVESLQLSYLVAGDNQYVNGESTDFNGAATVDWGRVVSVRATLVLKPDAQSPLALGNRTFSHVINLRNH